MTYLETVRRNIQSRDCDAFSRCAGVEPNPRPAGEWLDRQVAERKAVADLAENPSGAAVIACGRAIEEAGAREGAVGVDRIERVSDAPANVPTAIACYVAGLDVRAAAAIRLSREPV